MRVTCVGLFNPLGVDGAVPTLTVGYRHEADGRKRVSIASGSKPFAKYPADQPYTRNHQFGWQATPYCQNNVSTDMTAETAPDVSGDIVAAPFVTDVDASWCIAGQRGSCCDS